MRVQWVKCLLHKQENLSSDPSTYVKARCICNPEQGAETGRSYVLIGLLI